MTRRCMVFPDDAQALQAVADGEVTMADVNELQRFRIFLGNMPGHCPECLEPITLEHGPGSHPETLAAAKAKWPDLDDDELRERCLLGWQSYARGRVSLNAIAGLRR